eukprot:512491_1
MTDDSVIDSDEEVVLLGDFFAKIVLLGDAQVGKTALLEKYVIGKIEETHKATIGADFRTKAMKYKGIEFILQIWDTAGEERFRALGMPFYRGSNACVLVYDINNTESFDNIDYWREQLFVNDDIEKKNQNQYPFLLVANKCDLKYKGNWWDIEPTQRNNPLLVNGYCRKIEKSIDTNIPTGIIKILKQYMECPGAKYASTHGNMVYCEMSAVNGPGLQAAFGELAVRAKKFVEHKSTDFLLDI